MLPTVSAMLFSRNNVVRKHEVTNYYCDEEISGGTMFHITRSLIAVLVMVCCTPIVTAQNVHEYVVNKTASPIVIDGILSESDWTFAPLTESFINYKDGKKQKFATQGKMLWDETYLYIAFIMTDEDVWGEMTSWAPGDKCLCSEEVAEVFIDPDGDSKMYMEIEINPLGTLMDLYVDKDRDKLGGKAFFDWQFKDLKIGVSVNGTLNKYESKDKGWICELALPYTTMAFSSPTQNFPPKIGDTWRLNLYRYNYDRGEDKLKELSAWNQTDNRGFHAPDKFGRIIFAK
ncbi:carbohydrate-binding family 9-like protein [Candidatus Latescibacterota bacterium]